MNNNIKRLTADIIIIAIVSERRKTENGCGRKWSWSLHKDTGEWGCHKKLVATITFHSIFEQENG
jgi:hypothetical protein